MCDQDGDSRIDPFGCLPEVGYQVRCHHPQKDGNKRPEDIHGDGDVHAVSDGSGVLGSGCTLPQGGINQAEGDVYNKHTGNVRNANASPEISLGWLDVFHGFADAADIDCDEYGQDDAHSDDHDDGLDNVCVSHC